MEMNDLKDLLVENLKDLYSAEKQILAAAPRSPRRSRTTSFAKPSICT
jgi:ferritin-like metal-binding protein YciE